MERNETLYCLPPWCIHKYLCNKHSKYQYSLVVSVNRTYMLPQTTASHYMFASTGCLFGTGGGPKTRTINECLGTSCSGILSLGSFFRSLGKVAKTNHRIHTG